MKSPIHKGLSGVNRLTVAMVKMVALLGCVMVHFSTAFAQSQGTDIDIRIENFTSDSLLLGYHYGDKRFRLDTLVANDDTFKIVGDSLLRPGIYFLYGANLYFEFVIREPRFSMAFSANNPFETIRISDSRENELFLKFQRNFGNYQKQLAMVQDSLKNASSSDSLRLTETLRELREQADAVRKQLLEEYPDTWFSKVIRMITGFDFPAFAGLSGVELEIAKIRYIRKHYWDDIDDPADFMRTPVFQAYVREYFENIAHQDADSLIHELDLFLEKCSSDKETFQFWVTHFLQHYQTPKIMGHDKIYIHLIESYCLAGRTPWLSEKTLKELRQEVAFMKPGLIGNIANSFFAVDTTLQAVDFKRLKKNFLVLMFYDPDCGHCKKKVPLLNKLHPEIQALGGEIIGICTTTDVEEWKDFIKKQKLNWVHLADPQGRSRFRIDYNVRTTPQLYVLDKDFRIVGKNMDIETQLMDFLRYQFGGG